MWSAALCASDQKFTRCSQSCWEEEVCGLQPKVNDTFFGAEDCIYLQEVHGGIRKAVIPLDGQKGLQKIKARKQKRLVGLVAVNSDSAWVYTKGLYAFYAYSIGPLQL